MQKTTSNELKIAGMKALQKELGPLDMARFLLLFDKGEGNYTAERLEWLKSVTGDELKEFITKSRK